MLTDRSGAERAALARDVYTYLHFPMVAGIVLFAFAVKTTLADVDGELATIPALGLCGALPCTCSPSWRSACAFHGRSAVDA
jgi:low temperature requirement protein LtrA